MFRKKPDEEQLLQAPQHAGQLLCTPVIGQHGAEQQRAELGTQAELREQLSPAEREPRTEQHEQLPVAAVVEHLRDYGPRERQQQQQQRIRRRRFNAHHREQHDGHDVLHDQDADRDSTVNGPQLAIAFEHLRREHRAREPERERHDDRNAPRLAGRPINEPCPQDAGHQQVSQGRAPHFVPQQCLDPQLESDREQEQQHSGVREVGEPWRPLHTERAEQEPGRKKPDERRQPDPPREQTEQQGSADSNRDHAPTLLEALRLRTRRTTRAWFEKSVSRPAHESSRMRLKESSHRAAMTTLDGPEPGWIV